MLKSFDRKKLFIRITIIIILIISFLLFAKNIEAANDKKEKGGCLFCNTSKTTALKEKQFAERVKIIKSIFGNQINSAVLAATVIYINTDQAVNKYYAKDFSSSEYRENWQNIKTSMDNSEGTQEDWAGSIGNEEIDLLTAATFVMVLSNGFGKPYDEEAYVEALTLDNGVTNEEAYLGPFKININDLFCSPPARAAGTVVAGLAGGILALNPFIDYSIGDIGQFITNMNNICDRGFIGGVYKSVQNISDKEVYQARKKEIANSIIRMAKLYKPWFGLEDKDNTCEDVDYNFEQWKQYDSRWKSVSIASETVGSIGCTTTSVAMQIARSGTYTTNLPANYNEFNPGALATSISNNNGYTSDGSILWKWGEIAPNFNSGRFEDFISSNETEIANKTNSLLSEKEDGKYQRYLLIKMTHSGQQHWVAVEDVSGGITQINDPAKTGTTLSENYNSEKWRVEGYRIMWATDSGESKQDKSVCSSGIYELVKYLEGANSCVYRDNPKEEGYGIEALGDGAGYTTAWGITEVYDKELADAVGYSSFLEDIRSGCTNKEFIDKMFEHGLKTSYLDEAKRRMAEDSEMPHLEAHQIDLIGAFAYGTGWGGSVQKIIATVKQYGPDSPMVYECMVRRGCGYGTFYDLSPRRMAEYEAWATKNFNADKPGENYDYLNSLVNGETGDATELEKHKKTYWPTKRSMFLVEDKKDK